jgi:capsular polysaccharide transport system permease protein
MATSEGSLAPASASAPAHASRSAWRITLAVWRAMFLRDALGRLFASRAAWVWVLAEPLVHIGFMVVLYAVIRVMRVGGIHTVAWVVLGFLAYFMFLRPGKQAMRAVSGSMALFAYRQVKPVDAVLVSVALEGFLMCVVILLVAFAAALYGLKVVPDDPLMVMLALLGMWLIGLGFALISSVANELVPELGGFLRFLLKPLYFVSGVIISLSIVPYPYRGWLLLNPVAHGVEATRAGFSDYYHAVPELSLAYVYQFALASIFLGLALHRRFAQRMIMR